MTSIDGQLLLTRWKDNSAVTLASTVLGSHPTSKVRRYSRAQKKPIEVLRPHVVRRYNECMGGTDRMDQHINHCRVAIGGKKWWWSIFTWLLDASIQNAWRLHRSSGGRLTQVDFRRQIVIAILMRAASQRNARRSYLRTDNQNQRLEGIGHLIIRTADRARGLCRKCKSKVTTKCDKCTIFLCVDCFSSFHKNV